MPDKHLTTAGKLAEDHRKTWAMCNVKADDADWNGDYESADAWRIKAGHHRTEMERLQALPPETIIPLF